MLELCSVPLPSCTLCWLRCILRCAWHSDPVSSAMATHMTSVASKCSGQIASRHRGYRLRIPAVGELLARLLEPDRVPLMPVTGAAAAADAHPAGAGHRVGRQRPGHRLLRAPQDGGAGAVAAISRPRELMRGSGRAASPAAARAQLCSRAVQYMRCRSQLSAKSESYDGLPVLGSRSRARHGRKITVKCAAAELRGIGCNELQGVHGSIAVAASAATVSPASLEQGPTRCHGRF